MKSLVRPISKNLIRLLSDKLKIDREVMKRTLSLPFIYQQFVNAKWDLNKVWENNRNIYQQLYIYARQFKKQVRRVINDKPFREELSQR